MRPSHRPSVPRWLPPLLLGALFGGAVAQDRSSTPTAFAVQAPPGAHVPPVPLLWQATAGDNTVYLLGAFHLLLPSDYPLSRDVDLAFADAEKVMFELAPEEMSSPQLGLEMARAALRNDGTTLDSELPAATVARLRAWETANADLLARTGMTAASLQAMEPWFAALVVTLTEMSRMGLQPELGIDAHFAARAAAERKPTTGLETGAQQIAFLDGMSVAEQRQFLDEALTEAGKGPEAMQAVHRAWREGDAATLWQQMALDMRASYPALYQRINVDRNDAWLPAIEARLSAPDGDDTLVVVGALHLLGKDGVVEKLRARGHAVERICSACKAPATDTAVPTN